jgi:hypothetical protein
LTGGKDGEGEAAGVLTRVPPVPTVVNMKREAPHPELERLHAKVLLKGAIAPMEGIVWFVTPEGISFTPLRVVFKYGEEKARDMAKAYPWKDIETVKPA